MVGILSSFTQRLLGSFKHLPFPALLEGNNEQSRFSIFSANPYLVIYNSDGKTNIKALQQFQQSDCKPLELIKHQLAKKRTNNDVLPFPGGAIGYFAYDLARQYENLPNLALKDTNLPDMIIAFYDWALIINHVTQQTHLVRHPEPELPEDEWQSIVSIIENVQTSAEVQFNQRFQLRSPFTSNFTLDEYASAFNKIQEYILAGDCYQVNLAQRFTAEVSGSPIAAYCALSQQIQAPFSAFLQYEDFAILSVSPERFLKVSEGIVETKPIKGTRPRHSDPERDNQLANELYNSEKDRAENLMIVDLMRNDISKVCTPGSVKVPKLFDVETFTTVHHMVSTVIGKLASDKHAIDLLQACFPGGSVTGAPKIRAMEIIEELEPHRRGIYCGSIGYIGFNGNMDINIAIRTLLWENHKLHCYAGGAIVADSKMHDEYHETWTKVERILRILQATSIS